MRQDPMNENVVDRARRLWNSVKEKPAALPVEFIRPVKMDLRIEESQFIPDPERDYAIVVSDNRVAYLDREVKEFVAYHSGLTGWFIVAGYPYLNKDNRIEWQLRRE